MAAALAAWLVLGLGAPIIMSLYSSDIVGDAVEAAPADAVAITEPIVLAGAPFVRIERGTVAVVDQQGKPVSLVTGLADGQTPGLTFRLFNATVTVNGARDSQSARTQGIAPIVEALAAGKFEALSLHRTTVVVHLLGDAPETIAGVKAEVSLRRRGQISIKGSGQLRGQTVTLDALASAAQGERKPGETARLPIKLTLKSQHAELGFDGRLRTSADDFGLIGNGELTVPSIRQAARWFGAMWPSGPALRNVAIRGEMAISRQTLSFEKASFRMDGNEGTGVVALRVGAPRPLVLGTLAYKHIDTKPYLDGNASPGAARDGEAFSWSSLAAGVLTVPLGKHLDADLRISADKLTLAGVEFGRSAATVALKDGKLLADLAELKFNGGVGGGQITADFTGLLPRVTVRGKLDSVEAGPLASALIGRPLLQGPANIVTDVSGTGTTLDELLRGMAGKISVKMASGARLGLDLKALAQAAGGKSLKGWDPASRGTTAFDEVDLRLVLRDGTVLTESAEARLGDVMWSATGVVNPLADRIDLRLTQTTGTTAAAKANARAIVEMHGTLLAPSITSGNDSQGQRSPR